MLFISISCLLISSTISEACQRYVCDQKSSACSSETADATSGVLTYTLNNKCEKDKTWCNYSKATVGSPPVDCEPYTKTSGGKYPGQACKEAKECFSNTCTDGLCKGIDVCIKTSDCSVGKYCKAGATPNLNACVDLLKVGSDCGNDKDSEFYCELGSGCNNGKCTPYFSIDDSTTAVNPTQWEEVSFCASGKSENNKCVSKTNVGKYTQPCGPTNECTYFEKYTQEQKVDQTQCQCGKNPKGDNYCVLGNGMPDYANYVNQYKNYLGSLKNLTTCHSLERYTCPAANEKDDIFRTLENYRVDATLFHQIQNTNECITDIVFPNYKNSPVAPSCPVVSCKRLVDPKSCIESYYNPVDKKTTISASLCSNKTQSCSLKNWDINAPSNVTCTEYVPEPKKYRYPGESCALYTDNTDNCILPSCTKGFCSGKNLTESCAKHMDCSVGLFCNLTNNTCAKQLSKGSACTSDYQCQNGMGCMNLTCVNYYSQPLGALINKTANETNLAGLMCKSGMVDENKNCSFLDYAKEMKDRVDSKGFVSCSATGGVNSTCNYVVSTTGKAVDSIECKCPYSKQSARCPKVNKETDSNFAYLTKYRQEMFALPGCHTLNRFDCKDYAPETNSKYYEWYYKIQTEEAHISDGADSCLLEIFGSSNIFKVSFFAIILFIFHLV